MDPLVQKLWNDKHAQCLIEGFPTLPKAKDKKGEGEVGRVMGAWSHTNKQTSILIYRCPWFQKLTTKLDYTTCWPSPRNCVVILWRFHFHKPAQEFGLKIRSCMQSPHFFLAWSLIQIGMILLDRMVLGW